MSKPKSAPGPRWVGFDMDECLGSFMSLWPFTDVLPRQAKMSTETKEEYLQALARKLAFSEGTWLFRPRLDALLAALIQAFHRGQIAGCFILTNNGSLDIAEVVRRILNLRAHALKTGRANTPILSELFVVSWHRFAPCRRRSGLAKNIQCVQDCLAATGLPTLARRTDLLFFDDFAGHELAKEIPHYITVKPYFHYTPVSLIYKEIKGVVAQYAPKEVVDRVLDIGHSQEEKDMKADKEMQVFPPTADGGFELVREFAHFQQGSPIRTLNTVKTKGVNKGTGTRKTGSTGSTGSTGRTGTSKTRRSKN